MQGQLDRASGSTRTRQRRDVHSSLGCVRGTVGNDPDDLIPGPGLQSWGWNRPDPAADGSVVADHLSYERLVHDRRCRHGEIPAVERAAGQRRDVEYLEERPVDLIRSDVTPDALA